MAMNQWVAEMFGTAGASDDTSGTEKTAQLELFAKLAADEGIDLTKLTPQQVNELYSSTFGKQAESEEGESESHEAAESTEKEEGEKEEGDDEKEAAARAEHAEKKAQVAKLAEAELMGQVMAHSFVHELGEIEKSAAMPAALAKGLSAAQGAAGKGIAAARGAAGKGLARAKGVAGSAGKSVAEKAKGVAAAAKKHPGAVAGGLAGGAALGGAVGLGAHAINKRREAKKEASAFETLAAQNAIKVAAAAGYDEEEAYNRINSVYTLGLGESEKVAFIEDTSAAIHVRSLEYLEQAGYPVNWEEVYGQ